MRTRSAERRNTSRSPEKSEYDTIPLHITPGLISGGGGRRGRDGSVNAASSPELEAEAPHYDSALADEITQLAGDFSSPEQVNRVMGKIFDSLVHRRISPKEAATLCYIAQTALNGQRTVTFIEKSKPSRQRVYINDLPTAIRD